MAQMRKWLQVGKLRWSGASLHVHWTLVLAGVLLAVIAARVPAQAAVILGSLLALVLVHEAGHAYVVYRLGYEVTNIRLSLLHGRCEFEAPDTQWEASLVAWGGVAGQLLVAIPFLLIDRLWSGDLGLVAPAVLILGYWNLLIASINLLPWRGLDGQEAWRIVPLLLQRRSARRSVKATLRRFGGRR